MPLYEYRCEACGDTEERLESLSAPEAHDCPACRAPNGMKRQLSVAAFSLAGGGWFAQGYGASGQAATAAPAASAPAPAPTHACCGGCACAASKA